MRHTLLVVALLVLLPGSALAHGGRYRGPAGEIPPSRRWEYSQPPGSDMRPSARPGPERVPAPKVVPVPLGPDGKPPRPSDPRDRLTSYDMWTFWWHLAKDSILAERFPPRALTPEEEGLVDGTILPALRTVLGFRELEAEVRAEIRAGALIAIARAGHGTEEDVALMLDRANDPEEYMTVRESGVLGLAILGKSSKEVVVALRAIADDEVRPFRERCFALVALGLLRDRSEATFQCCLRRLDGRETRPDLQICALLSLGLVGDPGRAPALLELFRTGRHHENEFSPLVRSWVLTALGRIGGPAALQTALDALAKEKNWYIRRSAAIAVGRLLPQATEEERDLVYRRLKSPRRIEDRTARSLLLLGLARFAGSPQCSQPEAGRCLYLHRREIGSLYEQGDGGFLALALAIACPPGDARVFRREHLGNLFRAGVSIEGIRLKHGKAPELAAAHALALGLLGDAREETVDLLIETLGNLGHRKRARGSAAMALALLGDPRGAEPITKALLRRRGTDARTDIALAAGLLPTEGTTDALLQTMRFVKCSRFTLGSCATSLGRMRDFRALPQLIEILEPEKANGLYPDQTRALVCVALGLLGNRREGEVLCRISRDFPWRGSVLALEELLTIL